MNKKVIKRLREIRNKEKLNLKDILFICKAKRMNNNFINSILITGIVKRFLLDTIFVDDNNFNIDNINFITLILARLFDDNLYYNMLKLNKDYRLNL